MIDAPLNVAQDNSTILAINGGSSSIRFAVFQGDDSLRRLLFGKIDRIGLADVSFGFCGLSKTLETSPATAVTDYATAIMFLTEWLDARIGLQTISAIGHRIVHGMHRTAPEVVTRELLEDLRRIMPCDPQHLPFEIALVEAFRVRMPQLPQIVCFDTGFHTSMPRVAKLLSLPRRYDRKGIQRYGFHGLSYEYLMQELVRVGDAAATQGCVILAHLGNGASLAAVRNGKSIDTSMGFTPAAGLPMSTRSGDLDPGLVGYLAREDGMTMLEFDQIVNHESGLIGVSEISSDMQDLISQESTEIRAAEAVTLFCYQAKKWIGAFVAALGGVQTIVFAGGIGENAPCVRSRICEGLGCFGIEIDDVRNDANAAVISTGNSRVTVRVMRTDEEQVIARQAYRIMRNIL